MLDADHAGLAEVKERIVEYLAVRKFRREREIEDERSGAILALVGPPGVGKTSLGESIARALGREFVRMSLGGIRDEAEIRGHRRTYIGSLPGRLVRALRDAGTMNPVILLDEVDKLGADWRGDPAAALLEVLDPAQNSTFRDHYLDLEVDLSQVLFLATANVAERSRTRCSTASRSSISTATRRTRRSRSRPATCSRASARATACSTARSTCTTDVLRQIVNDYTREAGVRSLEREIGKLLRKAATKLASGEAAAPIAIGTDDLRGYLGRPRPVLGGRRAHERARRRDRPVGHGRRRRRAVHRGHAGCPAEGATLTGQLGDVMRESAHDRATRTCARTPSRSASPRTRSTGASSTCTFRPARSRRTGRPPASRWSRRSSRCSRARPVRHDVGMTGEVTLQGRVLPIGGLKQKVLAAHRAGLTDVILPARNAPELEELPERVREPMRFHPVYTVDEALAVALEQAPARAVAA